MCMFWGLTFDMSGGPKGAKRLLGRPLDREVRRPHEDGIHFGAPCEDHTTLMIFH